MTARRSILVLDQSLSSTGWALLAGEEVTGGAWPLCQGIRDRANGFRELWWKVDAIHKATPLAELVHEEPISTRVDKLDKQVALYGLVAVIELYGATRGLPVTSYRSDAWRATFFNAEEIKHFRGKDWKRPAIERCRQLGRDPNTGDEAEAFAILDHHLHRLRIMPPWREAHPFLETLA